MPEKSSRITGLRRHSGYEENAPGNRALRRSAESRLENAADGSPYSVGSHAVGSVCDPFADPFLRWLFVGRRGQSQPGQNGFVGDAVEGNPEGGATPCREGGLDFDECAVDSAGEGSEDPVNALQGQGSLLLGEAAAGDLFREDHGGRRLALNAGREDLFGDQLGGCSDEPADQSGEESFGNRALLVSVAFSVAHAGLRCAGKHDSAAGKRWQSANLPTAGAGFGRSCRC
jgi:hypothetical protein